MHSKMLNTLGGELTAFQIAIVSMCAVGAFAMFIVNVVAIICIFNATKIIIFTSNPCRLSIYLKFKKWD